MTELLVQGEEELANVVVQVLKLSGDRRKFALSGGLGAGKTTFTKAFCKQLGVEEHATSPTFSIVNQYVYFEKSGDEKLIHHLDLYRLKSMQEALDIGVEDYLYDKNYCLIEWPELIEDILPEDVVRINISILSPSSRKILLLL